MLNPSRGSAASLRIILKPRRIFVLGEAYAFGVMWSFSMKGLAVLVLFGYREPGKRDFRVPLNFTLGMWWRSRLGSGFDYG